MEFVYLPEDKEEVYIPVEETLALTKEECMEMGICYDCSYTFHSVLDDGGLCRFCDEDKWMRKKLGIPDDACWWEEHYLHSSNGGNTVILCGISALCLCRGAIAVDEMEVMSASWEKSIWPGGSCSQEIRDEKARLEREAMAKIQRRLMSSEFKESLRNVRVEGIETE